MKQDTQALTYILIEAKVKSSHIKGSESSVLHVLQLSQISKLCRTLKAQLEARFES